MWKGMTTVGLSLKKNNGFGNVRSVMSLKNNRESATLLKINKYKNENGMVLKNKNESVTLLKNKNETVTSFKNEDDKKGFEIGRCEALFPPNINLYFPSSWSTFNAYEIWLQGRSREKFDDVNEVVYMPDIDVAYPSGMKNCVKIVKGKRLAENVVSFLSNGGKRDYLVRNNGVKVAVESIVGKYLLICCFKVPLPTKYNTAASTCRNMIAAYSDLLENNNNFEMVMVAKMASGPLMAVGYEEEAAFNRFFAAFPCLAIPFWDTESRDFVCKSLGLTDPEEDYAALVMDPDQMVLQTNGDCFYMYGASGFPYSDDRLATLAREDEEMRGRLDLEVVGGKVISSAGPVSLVELLGGDDVLLSRFGGGGDKMSVSDLSKKKCVVLYLCMDSKFMGELCDFHTECVDENLEFEVVVLQVAFLSDTTSYAKYLQLALERSNRSHDGITRSWWELPLGDGEAARRLWRITEQYSFRTDELIILADGGNAVELDGKELLDCLENKRSFYYPFTRKSMLDKMFRRFRSVTLDSVLGMEGYLLLSSDPTRRVAVSELKGRNVLLYLDYYHEILDGGDHYKLVLHSYKQMQEDYPNSEVVFFPLNNKVPASAPVLPWLALPHAAAAIQRKVIRGLFPNNHAEPAIFAFGNDGLIHSAFAHIHLEDNVDGVSSVFADKLFQEIFDHLSWYLWGDEMWY